MANITDPLAASLHGTDPQNLLEYITRQKIYDSRYWKEECFGLTAVDVLEKSATALQSIGASYGGNRRPTKFLALLLKLLQLQPNEELVDELILQEDFKYTRALGAFYKRLTSRPADIYKMLEPLYHDYRKLRYRNVDEWLIVYMDEFVHDLLTADRVCGIALPRLPKRRVLEEEGYLDESPNGGRPSALATVLSEQGMTPLEYLEKKVKQDNSSAARALWEARQEQSKLKQDEKSDEISQSRNNYGDNMPADGNDRTKRKGNVRLNESSSSDGGRNKRSKTKHRHAHDSDKRSASRSSSQYGSLFKSSANSSSSSNRTVASRSASASSNNAAATASSAPEEGSDEYWNEQRAKLGLKPLKK